MFKLWPGQKVQENEVTAQTGDGNPATDEHFSQNHDLAMETVATMLRILGRHAFDLDKEDAASFHKEFEVWARHVLLGMPPIHEIDVATREPFTSSKRNWRGVCQFVNRHRQREKQYVVKGFQALREVIWTFAKTLSHAFLQDKDTDGQMVNYIGRLKAAVESKSPHELKHEVLVAAEGLSKLVEDRSQHQRQRLTMLGEKLKDVEEELGNVRKQMALDPLTRLYNRTALDQQLERVSALSIISGFPACLLMIDIDHFKLVNDTYGHRVGDAVIRQVADRTVLTFPRKDDFVARYGGEEFSVLLQGESGEAGRLLGERLLSVVNQTPFQYEELELSITVSIGFAEFIPGEGPGSWVERADQALYVAKKSGRNQVRGFMPVEVVL